jgi:RNA polymerase sigma factor (sigma-70 family)
MATNTKSHQQETELGRYQSLLFPFAYNITGDFLASEDIVQEVLNKHIMEQNDEIRNPRHYLIRSVVNKAINQKQLLRTRMEKYPGHWLPSPVITADSTYSEADRDKIIHYSLMVLIEQLDPKERAVFILKETFEFTHEEIAEVLKIKTESSRQLLKRSKEKIREPGRTPHPLDDRSRTLLSNLADAIRSTDIEEAKALLSTDVECVSDGGPAISASRNILIGQDRVSKLLKAIYGKYFPEGTQVEICEINHRPGIVFSLGGNVFRVIVFEIAGDVIEKIYIILNPDKVQNLTSQTSHDLVTTSRNQSEVQSESVALNRNASAD